MAVTIKQIAEKAGVSRGTVDRALNFRKDINPQQAERIRKIAEEMGYHPNRMARALAFSKNRIKIGVLLQFSHDAFAKNVMQGVEAAIAEMQRFQVDVIVKHEMFSSPEATVQKMEELKIAGCRGIAMVPLDEEIVREKINQFAKEGIFTVALNADISDCDRLCFVGQDGWKSGQVAAGLMGEILPEGKNVLIISGHPANTNNSTRTNGFITELRKIRPDIGEIYVEHAYESNENAANFTREYLRKDPSLGAIYLSAAGCTGVCKVVEEQQLRGKLKVISNDLTDENRRNLHKGNVQFLLGQDAFAQGYQPIQILFKKLVDHQEPESEEQFTDIEIKTKYNL